MDTLQSLEASTLDRSTPGQTTNIARALVEEDTLSFNLSTTDSGF